MSSSAQDVALQQAERNMLLERRTRILYAWGRSAAMDERANTQRIMLPELKALPGKAPAVQYLQPRPGQARTVTVLADAEGQWKGTRSKRTLLCKWKAVLVNAEDAKAGAGHAARVTSVIDKNAFVEGTAGFMPPKRKLTSSAESSVDMAVLMNEKAAFDQLLHNPLTRLSWAMDLTPALGREIAGISVTASKLTWEEGLGADKVARATGANERAEHVFLSPALPNH